jgi:hypothetical protein
MTSPRVTEPSITGARDREPLACFAKRSSHRWRHGHAAGLLVADLLTGMPAAFAAWTAVATGRYPALDAPSRGSRQMSGKAAHRLLCVLCVSVSSVSRKTLRARASLQHRAFLGALLSPKGTGYCAARASIPQLERVQWGRGSLSVRTEPSTGPGLKASRSARHARCKASTSSARTDIG